MEVWEGSSYDAILEMPSTRRQRLLEKKYFLERKRAQAQK